MTLLAYFADRRLSHFWDALLGFDIVKFDKHIKTPDGVSTMDHVLKWYGEEGVEIIEGLISK